MVEETEAVDQKVLTLRFDFEDFISKANIKEDGSTEFMDKMSAYMKEFKEINRATEEVLIIPTDLVLL